MSKKNIIITLHKKSYIVSFVIHFILYLSINLFFISSQIDWSFISLTSLLVSIPWSLENLKHT